MEKRKYKITIQEIKTEQMEKLEGLEKKCAETKIKLDRALTSKQMIDAIRAYNDAIGEWHEYFNEVYK